MPDTTTALERQITSQPEQLDAVLAEPGDLRDRGLAVVGHHDHGVAGEKLVHAARSPHETTDGVVAALEHERTQKALQDVLAKALYAL